MLSVYNDLYPPDLCRVQCLMRSGKQNTCLQFALSVCPAMPGVLFCGCLPKTARYYLFYAVCPAMVGCCLFVTARLKQPTSACPILSARLSVGALLFCGCLSENSPVLPVLYCPPDYAVCNPPVKTGAPILCRNALPDSRWSYRNNRPASSGYAPGWSACRFHSSRMSSGVRQGILPARTGWRSVLPAGL